MAFDTFIAFVGVYSSKDDAVADYEAIKDLHTELGLIDAYDAAVVERRDDGKVKIVKKHETPTRVGGVLGGGVGLATGLVIAAGMSRSDLKDLGEQLDAGDAGLIVVGASDLESKIDAAMKKAQKLEKKQLKADNAAIEKDAKEASKS